MVYHLLCSPSAHYKIYLNQSITSGIEPKFEIIGEYKNEITALFSEIINISKERKQNPFNQNISFGGEGPSNQQRTGIEEWTGAGASVTRTFTDS